jgi:hypothetical protein
LITSIAERYALLRYGPAAGRRAEIIAQLRASVGALPPSRALRAMP